MRNLRQHVTASGDIAAAAGDFVHNDGYITGQFSFAGNLAMVQLPMVEQEPLPQTAQVPKRIQLLQEHRAPACWP